MKKIVVLAIVGLMASIAAFADRGYDRHDRDERGFHRGADKNRWEVSISVDRRLDMSPGQERKMNRILAESDYAIKRIRFDRYLSPFEKRNAIERVLADREDQIRHLLSRKQYKLFLSFNPACGSDNDLSYNDRRGDRYPGGDRFDNGRR